MKKTILTVEPCVAWAKEMMTKNDVVGLLAQKVASAGGQRAWARENKVSAPYVNDVLHGNRDPGPSICKALGIRMIRRWVVEYKAERAA